MPRKYQNMAAGDPAVPDSGTLEHPIAIDPASTSNGNTSAWPSSVYDAYGCTGTETKAEAGPEVFYEVTFDQPGSFTAALGDDGTADLDVHILSQKNTSSCVVRGDVTATTNVGCGTYYVVVDTYGAATATANRGAFTLTTSFTGSGSACSSVEGPKPFNPKGGPGDACNSEGTPNEPAFCDVNLGAEACLSGADFSFCSMPCDTDNDCAGMTGGAGCCGQVTVSDGNGGSRKENYCYAASHCEGGGPSSGGVSSGGASGGASGGTSGAGGDDDDDTTTGGDDDGATADDDDTTSGGKKKKKTTTTTGCAAAPGQSSGAAFLLVGLGLAALGARRRRA